MCSVPLFAVTTTNPEQTCSPRDLAVGCAVLRRILHQVPDGVVGELDVGETVRPISDFVRLGDAVAPGHPEENVVVRPPGSGLEFEHPLVP
jgi:hypothetical protein